MKRKFSYKVKGFDLFLLLLGFALALYDMNELGNGVHAAEPNTEISMATLIAFAIATAANSFALAWGISNGKNKAEHIINKKSMLGLIGWIGFAIAYVAIEIAAATNSAEMGTFVLGDHIPGYVILAISYIFSGLIIQDSAREIWDRDASACRSSESEYRLARKRVAREDSDINYMLTTLENYNQNYKSLDEQYEKQHDAIRHAEDAVINEILGKTMLENPDITPSEARNVVEQAKKDFVK